MIPLSEGRRARRRRPYLERLRSGVGDGDHVSRPDVRWAWRGVFVFVAGGLLLVGCAARTARPPLYRPWQPTYRGGTIPLDEAGTLGVIGDLQGTSEWERLVGREVNTMQRKTLVEHLVKQAPDALVIVGDLVSDPTSNDQWVDYDALLGVFIHPTTHIPILPALGNHDYRCLFPGKLLCQTRKVISDITARFPWLHTGAPTHYRARFGNLGLVFLDSERIDRNGDGQRRYLEDSLEHFKKTKASGVLVFAHRPPKTNSSVRGIDAPLVQSFFGNTLESFRGTKWNVPMALITGHAHGYERFKVKDIHYIVSGGGGGPRQQLRKPGKERVKPDLYANKGNPECRNEDRLRPLNYLLITPTTSSIDVRVYGLCRGPGASPKPFLVESFTID